MRKLEDGSYEVERPKTKEVHERWVTLTDEGRGYRLAANAHRQRQLMEALSCGPVTTRELNFLYSSMSATIRTLEKKGIVAIEERRAWRGVPSEEHRLSSARAQVPESLTEGQRAALAAIERARKAEAGDVVVIDGVTGSGKTEVYLSAIEPVLAAGKSACVLVPEISLTAQTVGRFRSRFGDAVPCSTRAFLTGSGSTNGIWYEAGRRALLWARASVVLPLSGARHHHHRRGARAELSQGSSPRYHARDVAAEMARRYGCPLVLGSATPSSEALEHCRRGAPSGPGVDSSRDA